MINNKIYNKRYLIGDIHGFWSVILNRLNHYEDESVCYIQVGDFGIGINSVDLEYSRLERLNTRLSELNSDLYIVRGNHDDPAWFINTQYDILKDKLTNIFFVPDYTVLSIDNENILFIGGAISVDRVPRKMKMNKWWPNEVMVFDFDKVSQYRDIDRVICHTSPDFVFPLAISPTVYEFAKQDDLLIKDVINERKNLSLLVTKLMENNSIKSFAYGHFHNSNRFIHNRCEFICVDIDEFVNF